MDCDNDGKSLNMHFLTLYLLIPVHLDILILALPIAGETSRTTKL